MKFGNRINAIQIDLKGVLFKPSYFSQLMSDLKDQGVNAVLVEYEDVFPSLDWTLHGIAKQHGLPTFYGASSRKRQRTRLKSFPSAMPRSLGIPVPLATLSVPC